MPNESSKTQVAYVGFGVFKSATTALAEATVPSGPLDRHVLDKISGADYGALMSGLNFLGYVDSERRATSSYRDLILASKEENHTKYQALFYETLSIKYADVVGNVDVKTATLAELEKSFKAYGVPAGQMLTKTIRFYVKALTECGANVSPYITKPRPRSPRISTKKNDRQIISSPLNPGFGTHAGGGAGGVVTQVPNGFDRMPVPGLPQAFIQFPLAITPEQVELFSAVVNVLKTFAKGKSGKTEEVP
jgi:hypothetical protein